MRVNALGVNIDVVSTAQVDDAIGALNHFETGVVAGDLRVVKHDRIAG